MPSNPYYRFEDSPGLRHSCGVCGTPLNHPRAKKSCIGRHAEPCMNFHHTMFRMGRGGSCDACKKSRELHLKRHREIAGYVREINTKSRLKTPIPSLSQIAEIIHGYSEATAQNNRDALDRAMSKDIELREKLSPNCDKLPASDLKNEVLREIFSKLGINISGGVSKDTRVAVIRLADTIVRDIDTLASESRETMKRQSGYYRYADKRAYNAMIRRLDPNNTEDLISESSESSESESSDSQEEEELDAEPAEPKRNPPRSRNGPPDKHPIKMTLTLIPNTPKGPLAPRPLNHPVGTPLIRKQDREEERY